MTIKMIVDECDQILQTLLVLILLLQTAGSDPELSLAGKGCGSLRGSGLNQTNSISFFTTFNICIEHSRFGGGGVCGSEPPDPCWIHHCTVYILK
jgi:hypothetical protein